VESYPVYHKDSLLNSNPTFDFGAFRDLASRARSNSSVVKAFAFAFTTPGVYVFFDNANPSLETIVAVQRKETVCPLTARIVPKTSANLIALGVVLNTDLILAPDWLLIGIMGALIIIVFTSLIAGLYYFQSRGWSANGARLPSYRKLAQSNQLDLWTLRSKGSVVKPEPISHGLQNIQDVDLESGGDQKLIEPANTGAQSVMVGATSTKVIADGTTTVTPNVQVKKIGEGTAAGELNELKNEFDFEGKIHHVPSMLWENVFS